MVAAEKSYGRRPSIRSLAVVIAFMFEHVLTLCFRTATFLFANSLMPLVPLNGGALISRGREKEAV